MKEIHSTTFRTNETLARSAASKMFPNEKWLKKADGVYVAQSRVKLAERAVNEKNKLEKEIKQAKTLAEYGHAIFLTPEFGKDGLKQFDGLVDGNHTIDLKKTNGKGLDSIGRNFKDAAKKAEIIFFETTHKFSRQKIFDKMRGELLDMISRKTEVKTKTVWVKIQDSEIYELPISRLL